MKLKLDENLGSRGADTLRAAGHDVATVHDQSLTQASDQRLIAVCGDEGRCLVTLDLDFANPLVFVPSRYAGIAVLRPSTPISTDVLDELMHTLAAALGQADITGELWIVETGRVRKYLPEHSKP